MTQTLTEGKPYKQIIRFAIPLLIGNLFQQFYNMADAFIISHTLGIEAFAGVSSTGGISFLILGFASGMTSGLAIMIAKSFGAKDEKALKKHYFHNLMISLATAFVLTAISLISARGLLELLNTPLDIFDYALEYLQIIFAGIIASVLFNFFADTLRALGDSRSALHFLLIASALNIALDYILISFTPLGVRGAALATVISQGLSALLCYIKIKRSVKILSLKGYSEGFSMKLAADNLKLGLPMAFQSSIIAIGVVVMQFATNAMGTVAVAAYAVAAKIDGIAVEPLRSLGVTMTTFTAQNLGAGKKKRILKGVNQCTFMSIVLSVLLGLVMWIFGRLLTILFVGSGTEEILSLSHEYLIIHGVLYIILGLLFVYRFTLQGLGHAGIPTVAGVMELVMRVIAAFFLVPQFEFTGASIATPLSWFGALIPVAVAYMLAARKLKYEMNNPGNREISETELVSAETT